MKQLISNSPILANLLGSSLNKARWLGLLFFSLLTLGCSDAPQKNDPTDSVDQDVETVNASRYLYCITNIGHTMTLFDLDQQTILADSQKQLELDPIGPWFYQDKGYYISRVASSGAGKNALFEFDPVTLEETDRLLFPPNSNPNSLLILPEYGLAYVILTGSTFDNWRNNGLAVIEFGPLQQVAYLDLNLEAHYQDGELVASLDGLLYDDQRDMVYAVATNYYFEIRTGWLLALSLDGSGLPQIADSVQLGVNPRGRMVLEDNGELWVINNGGFAEFSGEEGSVQVVDVTKLNDGIEDNEIKTQFVLGGDPLGIYQINSSLAYVPTSPNDEVIAIDLQTNALAEAQGSLPKATGPFFNTAEGELFAGLGGFGQAMLGRYASDSGGLLQEFDLNAGQGQVECAQYNVQ